MLMVFKFKNLPRLHCDPVRLIVGIVTEGRFNVFHSTESHDKYTTKNDKSDKWVKINLCEFEFISTSRFALIMTTTRNMRNAYSALSKYIC